MPPKHTKQEVHREEIENRIKENLETDWIEFKTITFSKNNLYLICESAPYEFYKYKIDFTDSNNVKVDKDIYILWDGREIVSYVKWEEALIDMITQFREGKIKDNFWFYSSPLMISGILAIGLLGLIGILSVTNTTVAPQLWSIFTAVVAFYFGKQGWTTFRAARDTDT